MVIKKKNGAGKRSNGTSASRKSSVRSGMRKMSTRSSVGTRAAKAGASRKGRAPEREPLLGGMTVREAGRKGGLIGGRKGGITVRNERGREFYQEIGRMGGQRVRDLIAAGKKAAEKPARRRHT